MQGDERDYDEQVILAGHRFRLVRRGTGGDAEAAEDLVWRWSLDADAIGVSGAQEARAAGHHDAGLEVLQQLRESTSRVPVRDDALIADILQEWAIRHVEAEMPGYFANARVLVVGPTTGPTSSWTSAPAGRPVLRPPRCTRRWWPPRCRPARI